MKTSMSDAALAWQDIIEESFDSIYSWIGQRGGLRSGCGDALKSKHFNSEINIYAYETIISV